MASTIIYIKATSKLIKPVWVKMPNAIKTEIKTKLSVDTIQQLRTFALHLRENDTEDFCQGYVRKELFLARLSFEILVHYHNGNLVRRTMQRMNHQSPFIRLI